MSTATAGAAPTETPVPLKKDMRVSIVTARWNSHITDALRDGAVQTLESAGVRAENIECLQVAGTIELVNAAGMLVTRGRTDAVIIIGCVIRGDTPHFDYVCQHVTVGSAIINARGDAPVIFCVLTVENEAQALERAGGALGNKGSEAAQAAIEMVNLHFS